MFINQTRLSGYYFSAEYTLAVHKQTRAFGYYPGNSLLSMYMHVLKPDTAFGYYPGGTFLLSIYSIFMVFISHLG